MLGCEVDRDLIHWKLLAYGGAVVSKETQAILDELDRMDDGAVREWAKGWDHWGVVGLCERVLVGGSLWGL
jgi:hypothetical protein